MATCEHDTEARLEVTVLAVLLPVLLTVAAHVAGLGVREAQLVFTLAATTAVLVDQAYGLAERSHGGPLRVRSPRAAAVLAGITCLGGVAALHQVATGTMATAAAITMSGTALLVVALALPPLRHASGPTSSLVWRLLVVLALATAPDAPTRAVALAGGAGAWWCGDWIRGRFAGQDEGPTTADTAAPAVVLPAETPSNDPLRQLHGFRFGVISRGCEHRLVDAGTLPPGLPAGAPMDLWHVAEEVPVVNGSYPFSFIEPALARHGRLLVQVGDLIVGVLDHDLVQAGGSGVEARVTEATPWTDAGDGPLNRPGSSS